MREHFSQDFHIRVTSVEKHPSYDYHHRRWVVLGNMRSYANNEWGPGDFEWGFRIIILKDPTDGSMTPELFRASDKSGSYSNFFRGIIWRRVKTMLVGVLS